MNSSFNDFIEYCKSFYGYGGLYDQGRSREQIAYATCLYLDAIAHYDLIATLTHGGTGIVSTESV
jgi:hypothetical protein